MGCSLLSLIEIAYNIYAALFLAKHKNEVDSKKDEANDKKLQPKVDEEKD